MPVIARQTMRVFIARALVRVDGFGIREVLHHAVVHDDAVATEQLAAPGDGFPHTAGGEFLGEGGMIVPLCAPIEHVGDAGDDTDRRGDVGVNVGRTSGRWGFWSAGFMTFGCLITGSVRRRRAPYS